MYSEVLESTTLRMQKLSPALFFLIGFVFDVLTLDRIDSLGNLLIQALYLILVACLSFLEILKESSDGEFSGWREKVWNYRRILIHFFLGSLLSNYTLFYFKSASLFSSFLFIVILTALLILNEFTRIQGFGPALRFFIFSLCLLSYFIYLVPILMGYIGVGPFLIAMGLSAFIFFGMIALFKRFIHDEKLLGRRIRIPVLAVHLLFATLYFFQVIPPVPLSASYIGIYHDIQKIGDRYELTSTRPAWKFWQHGDQSFAHREGDVLYGYAKIVSPARFRDRIHIRWLLYEGKRGWQTQDVIPIEIVGGREKGYRGYTAKKNFGLGRWRFQVETTDNREIARLYFTVFNDESISERTLRTEMD